MARKEHRKYILKAWPGESQQFGDFRWAEKFPEAEAWDLGKKAAQSLLKKNPIKFKEEYDKLAEEDRQARLKHAGGIVSEKPIGPSIPDDITRPKPKLMTENEEFVKPPDNFRYDEGTARARRLIAKILADNNPANAELT